MILNKEEFFTKLHNKVGSSTSDEDIAFLEDMTDTYNDLEKRSNGDGVNWEQRYHELDESWKAKYKHRFFSGSDVNNPNMRMANSDDNGKDAESITISDLFTEVNK
ncbi:MAG: hypothetical protein J6S67_03500 [Methanobrevibacter sp.]|nr:hypothetical protein [Methanobrevibacter sp.]